MMKHKNIISRYTLQVPEFFKKNNIELFGALEKILQSITWGDKNYVSLQHPPNDIQF